MLKNYILVLDFDGVILDSAKENYYTGLLAYQNFKEKGRAYPSTLTFKNLSLKRFLEARPLCRSGDEFYIIFKLMEVEPKINFKKISSKKWKVYLSKYKKLAKAYTKIFYQTRKKIMTGNFKKWLKWQSPFKGILKEIKKAKNLFKAVIVATAKDKNSAKKILNYYNLKLKVIGREFSTHKDKQLKHIKEKFKIDYKNLIFIDDFIENLIVPKKMGVNVGLAGWGYTRTESLSLAKEYNIPVLKLANFNKQITKRVLSQNYAMLPHGCQYRSVL